MSPPRKPRTQLPRRALVIHIGGATRPGRRRPLRQCSMKLSMCAAHLPAKPWGRCLKHDSSSRLICGRTTQPPRPPSITLLARSRWKRAPSQYYAAGSEPSRVLATQGVDQSRAAVPRLWLYRSLPLPRVISQRHAFVCSSLKILLLSAGSSMGLQLQAAGWLSPSHSATRQAGLTKPSPSTQMIASAEAPADVLSSAQLDTSTVAGWSGSRSTCNTCFREKRIPLAGRLAGSGIPAEVHAPLGLATPIGLRLRGAGLWLEGSALSDERAQEGVFAA